MRSHLGCPPKWWTRRRVTTPQKRSWTPLYLYAHRQKCCSRSIFCPPLRAASLLCEYITKCDCLYQPGWCQRATFDKGAGRRLGLAVVSHAPAAGGQGSVSTLYSWIWVWFCLAVVVEHYREARRTKRDQKKHFTNSPFSTFSVNPGSRHAAFPVQVCCISTVAEPEIHCTR